MAGVHFILLSFHYFRIPGYMITSRKLCAWGQPAESQIAIFPLMPLLKSALVSCSVCVCMCVLKTYSRLCITSTLLVAPSCGKKKREGPPL